MPDGYKHFSKTKPMKLEHFAECSQWWNNRVAIKDSETDSWKAKDCTVAELAARGYDIDLCGYMLFHEKRDSLNAKIDHKIAEIEALLGVVR